MIWVLHNYGTLVICTHVLRVLIKVRGDGKGACWPWLECIYIVWSSFEAQFLLTHADFPP